MTKANNTTQHKMTFSGHDTFHCRHLWLKKGYDFVLSGGKFSNEDAVITLGVGKNMVSAINFWMKAFGLIDKENNLSEFADYIFGPNGKDPYLEDTATLWLLHYNLITSNFASTYNLLFNDLRRERIEFTKDNFMTFVGRKAEEIGFTQFNKNTVSTDFEVLTKMYIRTTEQTKDKEDTFSGLLTDLNIISEEKRKVNDKSVSFYSIPNDEKKDIPVELILYSILDSPEVDRSININSIYQDRNKAGAVFAISKSSLTNKLETIIGNSKYRQFGITFNDHAGIRELQFGTKPDKYTTLNIYYGN